MIRVIHDCKIDYGCRISSHFPFQKIGLDVYHSLLIGDDGISTENKIMITLIILMTTERFK